MPLYRNIRPFPISLENAYTGRIHVVHPNDTIELPESFASYYVHVLEKVRTNNIENDQEKNEPAKQEVPTFTENLEEYVKEEVKSVIEETVQKRSAGRPKKNVEVPSNVQKRPAGRPKKVV